MVKDCGWPPTSIHSHWVVVFGTEPGQLPPLQHRPPEIRYLRVGLPLLLTRDANFATITNSTWTSSGIGVRALSSCTVQLKVLKNVPSSYGALRDQSFVSHASTIETRMLHPQHEVHVCVIMHIQTSIQTRASYLIPGPRKGKNKERVTEIVPH